MKLFSILAVFFFFASQAVSQPMAGNYTVGGSSPDFAIPQDAAAALKSNGISAPVTLHVRPGTYSRDGGVSSVFALDSAVAGTTSVNRITIRPDAASGGSVDNVIFEIDHTAQSNVPVVDLRADFITFSGITLRDVDSAEAGANFLLAIRQAFPSNLAVNGTVIEGCVFLGNGNAAGGTTLGTDYGVFNDASAVDVVVRGNRFERLMRAVEVGSGSAALAVVEDNEVLASHFGASTTGSFLGTGISAEARNVVVRRNRLDNTGGRGSINGIIAQADTGIVERNTILNGGSTGPGSGQNGAYNGIIVDGLNGGDADSMLVVNNLVDGAVSGGFRVGLAVRTRARIVHNTIVHPARQQRSRGILFDLGVSDSSVVLNNIVLDYSVRIVGIVNPIILFDQTDGLNGLASDYNIFHVEDPLAVLVRRGATTFLNLADYVAATGLDSNTLDIEVEFAGGIDGPRLSECQGQDPRLAGTPIGVADDIDGGARSPSLPTRGADEGNPRQQPMFEEVFRLPLAGTPFSIAAGPIDTAAGDDLAVCDYDNREVRLFRNEPGTRSFSPLATLPIDFRPTVVEVYDLDADGFQDVIVGGETTAVVVHFGDGQGGFPETVITATTGRVVSIEPFGLHRLLVTEDNGFLPDRSFLGVMSFTVDPLFPGLRFVCHTALIRDEGLFTVTDTIPTVIHDIAVGEFDGAPGSDAVAIGLGSGGTQLVSFGPFEFRVGIGGGTCGDRFSSAHTLQPFNIGPFAGHTSNIARADYDQDGDQDVVVTGENSSLLSYLTNGGNFDFTEELLPTLFSRAVANLDYDGDGDVDIATANSQLEERGVTVFLNGGSGSFTPELNCYSGLATGVPFGMISGDFDLDGKADLAVASSFDSVFVLYNFGGGITAVPPAIGDGVPSAFRLDQNYPNPFNPSTTIGWSVASAGRVALRVYDLLGREVATLFDGPADPGEHRTVWDASGMPGGVYFCRLKGGSSAETKAMVLMR